MKPLLGLVLLAALAGAASAQEPGLAASLERVHAVLRPADFDAAGAEPLTAPFAGDLAVFYRVGSGDAPRFVQVGEPAAERLDPDLLDIAAQAALARASGRLVAYGEGVMLLTLDTGEVSAMLLYRPLWDGLAAERAQMVAAVPIPEALLVADAADPAALAELRTYVARSHGESARPLSAQIFRWTGAGWTPLD